MADHELYEGLRRRLFRLFQLRRAEDPEELASETVFRVFQTEARNICIQNFDAYASVVARNVWMEHQRERSRVVALPDYIRTVDPQEVRSNEQQLQCLEACMRTCLTRKEARLIESYYGSPRGETERCRQEIARKLGITENALRIRAFQVRRKLLACLRRCQSGIHFPK